jgi:hypothetical protein
MYVDFVEQRATIHAYVSFGLMGWGYRFAISPLERKI